MCGGLHGRYQGAVALCDITLVAVDDCRYVLVVARGHCHHPLKRLLPSIIMGGFRSLIESASATEPRCGAMALSYIMNYRYHPDSSLR
eukprot:COSAG01_NODE_1372_length_10545_cov_12.262876_7_plen_88_part_00